MPNRNKLKWFVLFTVPLIFIFTIVVLIPFLVGIYYSFFEWDGIGANPKVFVGLDNFVELWGDNQFLRSMWLTTLFTILSVITINVIGLAFALLVTSRIQSANAARTLLFMPYLIGGLILGYIWQFVFVDVFSFLGEVTGLDQVFFNWLVDPQFALYGLVFVFTWQMAGYIMIIYIAGIQAIPNDVVEAAKIDGASTWQRFTRITFPLLMPALTISLFLTLSSAFKIYDVNLSLTGGGPANATELFAMNIYQEIFGSSNYGFGQAKAIVFFLIVAAITLTQVYMTKKREVEM
ncbi:sugar ABC transporter permease [Planococcus liqunii]|uniref:carbohydrate ABC transporter permease n=1 Tax=Planococcus liqunii TaxID=3058394 RepID=UPI0026103C49|nr:sugar ABC transporter permease [Planococcus sp. N056]WKA51904.1 sugar ABC transporter permease [Planococcus sp. N056]